MSKLIRRTVEALSRRTCWTSHWQVPRPDTQRLLALQYQSRLYEGHPLPSLEETGFRIYSQTDEDGILLYLFSLIGTTNRTAVELCVESGVECNSANLIINHGWHALLFDGSEENIAQGWRFYGSHPSTRLFPPILASAWIDAENINRLIAEHHVQGVVDLLSVDIDGVDYWIWKAIECIQPRVVLTEINPSLGNNESLTVPYHRDFQWAGQEHPERACYYGASLRAMVNLAADKGFRFVGMNRLEHNAFFVREDLAGELFPARDPAHYLARPYARACQARAAEQGVLKREWVSV